MEVRRLYPYHDAAVFGDNEELACIPHRGCRLEIVAAPETPHGEVNLLLPGQVVGYTRSFFFGDRFELPSGKKVGLYQLVGFKLQLAPPRTAPPRKRRWSLKLSRQANRTSSPSLVSLTDATAPPFERSLGER
jgi:hypothetical protein